MRNSFIALFLVCLLGMAFSATSADCQFSNLYTKHLQKHGVSWLSKADTSQNLCGTEWSQHGTCCDTKSLRKYVSDEIASVDKIVEDAKSSVQATLQTLKEYRDQFSQIALSKSAAVPGEINLLPNQRQKIYNENYPKMNKIISWVEQHSSSVIAEQSACLNRFKKVRSGSVCYTCSARASVFFTKDELHLHEDVCRQLISDCRQGWTSIIEYLDQVNAFYKIIKEVDLLYNLKFAGSVKGSPANQLLDWADKSGIRKNLRQCSDSSCDFSTATNICNSFVSIEQPLYIVEALNNAKGVSSMIGSAKKVLIEVWNKSKNLVGKIFSFFKGKSQSQNTSSGNSSDTDEGRKLIGKVVTAILKQLTQAPAQVSTAVNVAAQPAQSTSAVNPLICPPNQVCVSDKLVMSSSACGSAGVKCASSDISFP